MEQFPYLHGTFVELRPRAGIPYLLQPEFDEIIVDPVLWICLRYHLSNTSPPTIKKNLFKNYEQLWVYPSG